MVDRANDNLETSFLPGRTFASPEDFNARPSGGCPGPTAGWSGTPEGALRS